MKLFHQQLLFNKGALEKVVVTSAVNTWSLTLSLVLPEKSSYSAKEYYSLHWKFKGDMALILDDLDIPMTIFDFGYLLAEKWVKG